MEILLFLYLVFVLMYSYIIADHASERGLNGISIFILSLLFTPILGMFMILATPTKQQKELEEAMLNYYKTLNNNKDT